MLERLYCVKSLKNSVIGNVMHSGEWSDSITEQEKLLLATFLKDEQPPIVKITLKNATLAYVKRIRKDSREVEKLKQVLLSTKEDLHKHLVHIEQEFSVAGNNYAIFTAAQGIAIKRSSSDTIVDRIVSLEQMTSPPYITAIPLSLVLGILVQILCLLVLLQNRIPNFSHNDFKLDNILFVPLNENEIVEFNDLRIRIPKCPVRVVLIDMETVIGKGIEDGATNIPLSIQNEFGFGSHLPYCEYTDFHLLIMLLVKKVQTHAPIWGRQFFDMLDDWRIERHVFDTFQEGNNRVTRMNRLTGEAREAMQKSIADRSCPPLRALLYHHSFDAIIDTKFRDSA